MRPLFLTIFLSLLTLNFSNAAESGVSKRYDRVDLSSMDRCPVCGEYIFRHQKWAVLLYYEKNNRMKHLAFDGVKEFLKFYLNPQKWGDYPNIRMHIKKIVFRDYISGKPVVSYETWFVLGSDIKGPKGNDLIPFSSKEAAEKFMKSHNGSEILSFEEITEETLKRL